VTLSTFLLSTGQIEAKKIIIWYYYIIIYILTYNTDYFSPEPPFALWNHLNVTTSHVTKYQNVDMIAKDGVTKRNPICIRFSVYTIKEPCFATRLFHILTKTKLTTKKN